MTRDSLSRLSRLVTAMAARKRALDIEAHVLTQRLEALCQSEREAMAALDGGAFQGVMSKHGLHRIETLSRHQKRMALELQAIKLRALEVRRTSKRCEILKERAVLGLARHEEGLALERAVEGFLARRPVY